jgi:mycothiol synthase
LAALITAALPHEGLTADELLACCWEDPAPSVVLTTADGTGVVSTSAGPHGMGFVKLVAVHPEARRQGHGRALLDAAHAWLSGEGCTHFVAGAASSFSLWPGVDVTHTEALCLFESAGYEVTGGEMNMRCSTTFRADAPDTVAVRRVLDDDVVDRTLALVRREWPWWDAEVLRAVEHGCCHVALRDDDASPALGFACHSVNRAGWIGPMGTAPTEQRAGIGAALLSQVCRDLMTADFAQAEIASVGPVSFFAKAAGATVSRSFRSFSRRA